MIRANRIRDLLIIFLLSLFLAACAILQESKSWSEWTPKEKAAWMNATYNRQYDDYIKIVNLPNLSLKQKGALRLKKEILREAWPLLKLYSHYAANGQIPAIELEAEIMKLINRLLYGGA